MKNIEQILNKRDIKLSNIGLLVEKIISNKIIIIYVMEYTNETNYNRGLKFTRLNIHIIKKKYIFFSQKKLLCIFMFEITNSILFSSYHS